MLLVAPHRLAFTLAMLLLVLGSLWWLAVQFDRTGGQLGLSYAVAPSIVHAAVMVYGFMPLFFAGFLFTAGPRWLNVPPPTAPQVAPALILQALGWLLWLPGAHTGMALASVGMGLALLGLGWMYLIFVRLVRQSQAADRSHGMTTAAAGVLGTLALGAAWLALLGGHMAAVRVAVLLGLWLFVVPTYMAVAHRMLPFFTANAVGVPAWRPRWVLGLMLGAAAFEAAVVLAETLGAGGPLWRGFRALVEAGLGGWLLWLSARWGLRASWPNRLLAVLHVGFIWLGLAFALSAGLHALALWRGALVLALGGLHALTMGFLGSVMLAMVSRVSLGHSGRPLKASGLVWALFWLLQAAVGLRLVGAAAGVSPGWMLAAAALWTGVMLVWAAVHTPWYMQPRRDGQPG